MLKQILILVIATLLSANPALAQNASPVPHVVADYQNFADRLTASRTGPMQSASDSACLRRAMNFLMSVLQGGGISSGNLPHSLDEKPGTGAPAVHFGGDENSYHLRLTWSF